MPGPVGVISILSDEKYAIICVDKMYWDAVAAKAAPVAVPMQMILGRPALAKFMAASHYACNTLKMPGPMGVISIPSDEKDAIICVDMMY